jgi:ABC-type transporter Mla subunit MlaD
MTELEQALSQELNRLRSAVDYIEEANQQTASALTAAETLRTENERTLTELRAMQQRLDALEATIKVSVAAKRPALITVAAGSAFLLGCCALLWGRRG